MHARLRFVCSVCVYHPYVQPTGQHRTCKVLPHPVEDSATEYTVHVAPASASVVVVPWGNGRRSDVENMLQRGVPQNELCEGSL